MLACRWGFLRTFFSTIENFFFFFSLQNYNIQNVINIFVNWLILLFPIRARRQIYYSLNLKLYWLQLKFCIFVSVIFTKFSWFTSFVLWCFLHLYVHACFLAQSYNIGVVIRILLSTAANWSCLPLCPDMYL